MNIVIGSDLFERSKAIWQASPYSFHPADGKDAQALADAVKRSGARALIIGTAKYPDSFFEELPPQTLVQRYGVGYDAVPLALCQKRGLYVGYTPGTLDRAVAEQTFALMLAWARRVVTGDQKVRQGGWGLASGLELGGLVLGLLGWGPIAQKVAHMAHHGFGMNVCVWRREPILNPPLPLTWCPTREELVAQSDVVSLHLKAVPELKGVVNRNLLRGFKKNACLVNTARGLLVDEGDLYDALVAGDLAGAALDVFAAEPYVPVAGKDLRSLEQVLLAPHAGSNTSGANGAMARSCLANVAALAEGRIKDLVLVPAFK